MLVKKITYEDYNGLTRTEEFCFHLSKPELMEMELDTSGGMAAMMERIVNAQDYSIIVKTFKELILKSYGIKTPDGRGFIKIDDNGVPVARRFEQSPAFEALFMELSTDDKAAAEFVMKVVPKDIADQASKETSNFLALDGGNK